MFGRGISWLLCIFVAVLVAADYNDEDLTTDPTRVQNWLISIQRLPAQPAKGSGSGRPRPLAESSLRCPTTPLDAAAVSRLRMLSGEEKAKRLKVAAAKGRLTELRTLLAAGADVEGKDSNGWSALIDAAGGGHLLAMMCLVEAGADANKRFTSGWAALHSAANLGLEEVVRFLLKEGVAVDPRDGYQKTPLHWAAAKGFAGVVRLLLATSADVNAKDMWGATPLHYASEYGYPEVATALVAAGADTKLKNNNGKTPLDLARREKKQQLVDILSKA